VNITVFGASGGIGDHVVALAALRGHHVRAVHRQAPAAPLAGAETVIAPDVFDPGFALLAVKDADAVVSVVGPNFITRHNPRTPMTSPPDLHQRLARTLITAMEAELAASGLDWYAPRPVKLTDGPLTRNVRASDRVTVKPISRADVAWHILTLAEDPDPGPLRTPAITTGPGRKNGTAGSG
jgi:NAD(P)H-binding